MTFQCNQWIHPVTHIRCNFFCWHPSSRQDCNPFQPTVNFLSQPLASSQPPALPPASQVVTLVKCLTGGCNSARIRKGCTHQCCKHHCKEQGGCLSHGNTQLSADAVPALPPASIVDPSLLDLAETQAPTTLIATRAPPRAEPIHASHILPVFTQRWATEHSLREEQRKLDAEKLANLQKTKHTVFVYAWIQVSFLNSYIINYSLM